MGLYLYYMILSSSCACVLRTEQRSYVCTGRVYFKKGFGPVKFFLKFR